jgi:hypothetical protein
MAKEYTSTILMEIIKIGERRISWQYTKAATVTSTWAKGRNQALIESEAV